MTTFGLPASIKVLRYFGRIGVRVDVVDEGDRFGQIGSKGRSYHLYVWKDPA